MKLRLVIVGLIAAALIGGLAWFQLVFKPEMIKGFIARMPQPPVTVAVSTAEQETWIPRIKAIGTLKAVNGVDVTPQVAGVVKEILFQSGQDVEASDVLLQLDDAIQQADLKANMATMTNATQNYERIFNLFQGGNAPKSTLDDAQQKRDEAVARVEQMRAQITQKQIAAPFSGRLGIRKVDLGQYLSPGTPIVSLQALDPIYADFSVPEQNFAQLEIGQKVRLGTDAYPGEVFEGTVTSIDVKVDVSTRNVQVRATLPNTDFRLRPGMFANVEVLAGEPRQIVTVPRTAVTYSLYGDSIYVVKEGATSEGGTDEPTVDRRFVRTGATVDGRVEIVEGIRPGDVVVTVGQLKLRPGAKIRVDEDGALVAPAQRPKE